MSQQFPRTTVGGISLPRMLVGTNWLLGYSHTSPAADAQIARAHAESASLCAMLDAYLAYGIDAVMGPFLGKTALLDAIRRTEDKHSRKITLIDTPILDLHDSADARRDAERVIREGAKLGASFCLIHHSSVEQLVSKLHGTIDRLPDYTKMIRDAGLVPGLSAHMPELIVYSDDNGYDVETYIQIYNCLGFMMQVEIEQVHKILWNAKKPVMTIKSMAAGRVSPFVGITFSYSTIRPCDMVTLGAYTPAEVHEDVEIALAALERRPPDLEGRASPNAEAAVLSGKA